MFQIVREPDLAKRIYERRMKINLSQTQCATAIKVTKQMWNNWEMGYCRPKGQRLKDISKLLKCDPVWLMYGDQLEIDIRLDRSMLMLRSVTRDLDHIRRSMKAKA